jgi:hypothetical protein
MISWTLLDRSFGMFVDGFPFIIALILFSFFFFKLQVCLFWYSLPTTLLQYLYHWIYILHFVFLYVIACLQWAMIVQWYTPGLLKVGLLAVWVPAGSRNFSLHHCVHTSSGPHPASYPVGTRGSYLGVKRPGREADHSFPSSAKVKNMWSYTSPPQYASMSWCSVMKVAQGQLYLYLYHMSLYVVLVLCKKTVEPIESVSCPDLRHAP